MGRLNELISRKRELAEAMAAAETRAAAHLMDEEYAQVCEEIENVNPKDMHGAFAFREELQLKAGKGYWRSDGKDFHEFHLFGGDLREIIEFATEGDLIDHYEQTLRARLFDND